MFLTESLAGIPVRGLTTATGNLSEAQFPLAIALAALSLSTGEKLPVLDPDFETEADTAPSSIGVLAIGFNAAEGMAVVRKAEGATA